MKKYIFLIIVSFYCRLLCSAQNPKIDSLNQVLLTANEDTTAFNTLIALSRNYGDINEFNKALECAYKGLDIAKKIKSKKGEAEALFFIGRYEIANNHHYEESTLHLLKSLEIYDSLHLKKGVANCNLQLGVISYSLQDYPDALSYFKKSVKYHDEDDSYQAQKLYLVALCYSELDSFEQAIPMFNTALTEYIKIQDEMGILQCRGFIGKMYSNIGSYKKAIDYLQETRVNYMVDNDSATLVAVFAFLSTAYLKINDCKNAIFYGNIAYRLGNFEGGDIYLKEAEKNLYIAYEKTGDIKKAYFFLNTLHNLNDSIYSYTTLKRIAEMKSQYEYTQQRNIQKAEQEKKDAIAQKELQKQKLVRNGFVGGFAIVLLFAGVFFTQRNNIRKGKKHSDELLLNILPEEVAEELKEKGYTDARQFENVTVLFTDFKGFTVIAQKLTAQKLVEEINESFSAFDKICEKHGMEKIKTIGDSYMAAGGLPTPNKTHAQDAINAALEIRQFIEEGKIRKLAAGQPYFEIRIGIHTGPVIAGIVGVKKFAYDIWGDTVNTASRMESSGEVGQVNISGTTYELVKDKFTCTHRGKITAKGKGEIDMYFVRY